MKTTVLVILIAISLASCRSVKEVVVLKESVRLDTVRVDRIVKVQVPVINTIEIESPCDSVGNLKPFKQTFKTDKVNVLIKSVNNNIVAEIDLDSIKDVWHKEYISKNSDKSEVKVTTITKYKTPKWLWWVLVYAVLMTVWKFKKFIPYLNMLPF